MNPKTLTPSRPPPHLTAWAWTPWREGSALLAPAWARQELLAPRCRPASVLVPWQETLPEWKDVDHDGPGTTRILRGMSVGFSVHCDWSMWVPAW